MKYSRWLAPFVVAAACASSAQGKVVVYLDPPGNPASAGFDRLRPQLEKRPAFRDGSVSFRRIVVSATSKSNAIESLRAAPPGDVFVTAHTVLAQAVAAAFPDKPIVLLTLADPYDLGLVDANGKATANVTGFTFFSPFEMKHFEVLRMLAPGARHVGVMVDRHWANEKLSQRILEEAPKLFGHKVRIFPMEPGFDVNEVLGSREAREVDAWFIPDTPTNRMQGEAIATALRRLGRPSIGGHISHARSGGLAVYEPERVDPWPLIGAMVSAILSGVPARDIAFDRPKSFRLIINAGAAKSLGLTVPVPLLKQANEVIQ